MTEDQVQEYLECFYHYWDDNDPNGAEKPDALAARDTGLVTSEVNEYIRKNEYIGKPSTERVAREVLGLSKGQ